MTLVSADLLTEEEVRAVIEAAGYVRDRAMIAILYEGGLRVGELGALTWGQVQFVGTSAILNICMKNERPRHIRLIASTPYLAQWRCDYPLLPEGDVLVFISQQRESMLYVVVAQQIRKAAILAGLKKNVRPHIFRHSRVTHLA